MRVVLLTREYPPEVYGGAGVHIDYLSRELARLVDVEVRCFGAPRPSPAGGRSPSVRAYRPWKRLATGAPYDSALQSISVDLAMAAGLEGAAILHSHTWYANLGGHFAKLLYGIPHVVTSHSLEPLREWKAEQLGAGGYALSRFCEQMALEAADAVVAVSNQMREDVLRCYPVIDPARVRVVHNGIDPDEYRPDPHTDALERLGVDPTVPSVVFVGRNTRQKGLAHLLEAATAIDPTAQLVVCSGAPDTPAIQRETADRIARVMRERDNVVWVDRMLARREVIQILTHATVFCCPSIYEPLGIVNLEAMACEAPVVATATGGIPEVVEDGVTGLLVPFEPRDDPSPGPKDPERFAHDIAERVNALLADPDRARALGKRGRQRVLERFTWAQVARRTLGIYERLLSPG